LQALYFVDAAHGWAVGHNGRILRVASALTDSPAEGAGSAPPAGSLRLTAHPNPFNPAVELRFSLPVPGEAILDVFDIQGRHVSRLREGRFEAGEHIARWEGRDVLGRTQPSGVYFARLEQGAFCATRKLLLLK
jgi:hypothetical protein